MAAATVVSYKNPEGNLSGPTGNTRLHRWNLTFGNADTHDTGLENVVEYAIKATGGDEAGVASVTAAGVFTFDANGSQTSDLLVWSAQ